MNMNHAEVDFEINRLREACANYRIEIERLRYGLTSIADAKPMLSYVTGPGFSEPGSPYDRGLAAGIEAQAATARATLSKTKPTD